MANVTYGFKHKKEDKIVRVGNKESDWGRVFWFTLDEKYPYFELPNKQDLLSNMIENTLRTYSSALTPSWEKFNPINDFEAIEFTRVLSVRPISFEMPIVLTSEMIYSIRKIPRILAKRYSPDVDLTFNNYSLIMLKETITVNTGNYVYLSKNNKRLVVGKADVIPEEYREFTKQILVVCDI